MDKIKLIPAIAPTSSGPIDFYLRLDQVIAIAYANDPEYKDNYFVVFTKEDDDSAFYYVHKHIIRKYFDLEQMLERYFYSKEEYDAYKNSEVITTSISPKVE